MKQLTDESYFAQFLAWLARMVLRYQKFFLYTQAVLFILSVFYTWKFLELDTSRNNLVGADKAYHQNFIRFREEFPQQDDLVVVVESENAEKNRQFVERLGAKLEAETNLFDNVFYKGDLKMLGSKALMFVPEPDLRELQRTLRDYRPFVEKFSRTTNLVSLFDMVNEQFRTAPREQNEQTESLVNAMPALERIVNQAAYCLPLPGTPPSPGINALFGAGQEAEQQMYITFAEGRIYLVTAHAPTAEITGDTVKRLRELVEETKLEVPGLNVGVTGEPILELDEMKQSEKDSTIASIASLIICALIFIYGYQETGRPVKATICLVVGIGYTMAFTTLVVGHLNILTITFVPILIGLAIDFGVHLITRYEEELRHGKTRADALHKAMVFTGQGIFTGAFTTAGAFLAMGLTDFKGIQEMGIICGGGLLVCLIPMTTMLPVLLLRGRQNVIDHAQRNVVDRRERIENIWLQRPKTVMAITVILCGLAATQLPRVYFDYNLLNMQSEGLPAVEFEEKLIDSTASSGTNGHGRSLLFAAVIATNLQQAVELEAKLKTLPSVATVESMARYLMEDQTAKLRLIGEIKNDLANISFAPPAPGPVNIHELSRTLYSFNGYLGMALAAIGTNEPALSKQLGSMQDAVDRLRKAMFKGAPATGEEHAEKLGQFQRALFNDIRQTFDALKNQDNSASLRIEDLPKALHDRFVGRTGKFLLQVYPKGNVWQRETQEQFVKELQTIDKNATGTPVQLYYYTELLKESYQEAALYALGAIVILVLVHFRNVISVALALLPVAIGAVWLGGLMGFFQIPLNPANIMTLPLVIGIGVTNGIHILNRFAEEQNPSILARSTGKAVLVSGLTTIAGFGSLILAKHQGIHSLGLVMATGVTTCMVAGLTSLPALLNLMTRKRSETKK